MVSKFVILFRNFFYIFLVLFISFSSGFSADSDSSDSSFIQEVRDQIWDVALRVYFYETVLFEPSTYFSSLGEEDTMPDKIDRNRNTTLVFNVTPSDFDREWSEPKPSSRESTLIVPNVPYSFDIPNQLFDITFTVSDFEVSSIDDLIGIVTFESFGSEPTPVNMTFVITSFDGIDVYTSSEVLTVETSRVYFKEFVDEGLILEEGEYFFNLNTVYNVGIRDNFEQRFRIGSDASLFSNLFFYIIFLIIFVIFSVVFFYLRLKRTKRLDEEETPVNFNSEQQTSNKVQSTNQQENYNFPNQNSNFQTGGSVQDSNKKADDYDEFDFEGGDRLIEDEG